MIVIYYDFNYFKIASQTDDKAKRKMNINNKKFFFVFMNVCMNVHSKESIKIINTKKVNSLKLKI